MPETIETIGAHAFENCGFTGVLEIPKYTQLEDYAFYGCSKVVELSIPESLETIPEHAFAACSGLQGDLTIPDGTVTIEEGAFEDCFGYSGTLYLPDGLQTIENNAFKNTDFEMALIPDSVMEIGEGAFEDVSEYFVLLAPAESAAAEYAMSHDIAWYDSNADISAQAVEDGISVLTDGQWHVEMDADWVTLSSLEGVGDGYIEYSLEDNPSTVTSRTARIEFVCGEKTAVVELVQKPKETVIANLSLVPGELKVQAGTECTVKALVLPEEATNSQLNWSVSDDEVASITPSEDGRSATIGFIKAGTVTVTAEATDGSGLSDTCTYTVTDEVLITGLTLSKSTLHTTYGSWPYVEANITPANADNQTLIWKVDDEEIATLSAAELRAYLTFLKQGTVTVTAMTTDGSNLSAECSYTAPSVTPVSELTLLAIQESSKEPQPDIQTVLVGKTYKISADAQPTNATNRTVEWSSSDETVASITQSGNAATVTVLSEGLAVLTARTQDGSGLEASCTYRAILPVEQITCTREDKKSYCFVGQEYVITATVLPETAGNKGIVWKSSDENVATVEGHGNQAVVSAVGVGTADITASATDGSKIARDLYFRVYEDLATDLTLTCSETEVVTGDSVYVRSSVSPSYITNKELTWESSDESIAVVTPWGTTSYPDRSTSGKVVFLREGSVTITARTTDGSELSADYTFDVAPGSVTMVSEVQINLPESQIMEAGKTYNLGVSVLPSSAINKNLKWTVSDSEIATIDEKFKTVSFHKVGQVTITATTTDGTGISVSRTYVVKGTVPMSGIELVPAPWNLEHDMAAQQGRTYGINANVLPEDTTNASRIGLEWSSSDDSIVKVVPYCGGYMAALTFLKEGDVTITARTADGTFEASYVYHAKNPKATSLEIYEPQVKLGASPERVNGRTYTLYGKVLPADAINKNLTWESSDESIAKVANKGTIDSDGNVSADVTFLKSGTVTITARTKDGTNLSARYSFTVLDFVESVTLNKTALDLKLGATEMLTASVLPGNAYDKTVSWSSGNPNVAFVCSTGTVYAAGVGTTTITATSRDGQKTATCNVTVTAPVTGVELSRTSLTLLKGNSAALIAAVLPSNASNKAVTWSSSNTNVASVDSSGKVTAKAAGNASITVKTADGSKTASCSVQVTEPVVEQVKAYNSGLKSMNASTYAYAYMLSNGHINVYTDEKLTTRGTVTSGASTVNYIDGNTDEIWLLGVGTASNNVNWAKVSYPAGSSRKVAYVRLDQIVAGISTESKKSATKYYVSLRKGGAKSSSHYVAAGDTVYLLYRDSSNCQILYPVSGGKWRIAWCTCDDYDRTSSGSSGGSSGGSGSSSGGSTTTSTAHKTSAKGQQFIKAHEGLKLTAYNDGYGTVTIGWGHTANVYGNMSITQTQAQTYFDQDLSIAESVVNTFASNYGVSFTQQQYDALVCLAFNIKEPFQGDYRLSRAVKAYKSGTSVKIPTNKVWECFVTWHHAGGVDSLGLYRRRLNEARLFALSDYTRSENWAIASWLQSGGNGGEVPDDWVPDEYSGGNSSGNSGGTSASLTDEVYLLSPALRNLSTTNYAYCYTLSNGRVTPYTDKTLATPGTTSGASSSSYIDGARDELWLMGVGKTNGKLWAYVSYPITGTSNRRTAYLPLSAIVEGNGVLSRTSTLKYYVSNKCGGAISTSHYVAPGDKVYLLTIKGDSYQICYPVSGGKWRIAWCSKDQYNNKTAQSGRQAVDINAPTVWLQKDSDWCDEPYGYMDTKCTEKATVGSSGCGLLSIRNAIYSLTGQEVDVRYLAKWSLKSGYRVNGSGTDASRAVPGFCRDFGDQYGVTYAGHVENPTQDPNYITKVREHLIHGGVAIVSLKSHLVCVAAYETSRGFLVLDSYPSEPRGTLPKGIRWISDSNSGWSGNWYPMYGFYLISRK